MSKRNCIDCAHFRYDSIRTATEDHYGAGGFDCAKGHYQDRTPFDANEVRQILWIAVECSDFESRVEAQLDAQKPNEPGSNSIHLGEQEMKIEPVAWLSTDCIGERFLGFSNPNDNDSVQPLYTESQLQAAVAEYKQDAERYRFIRDVPYSENIRLIMRDQSNAIMDAAIDAARKEPV